ncbi:MAG: DUF433 domain-containing protein [Candidatus Latescibacterota bacterium]|jgi:uncharacterized protein (DUF433 family)
MTDPELLGRISVDPRVMVGKPTIRGLRITLGQVLAFLAAGMSTAALLEEYPELEPDDIRAALLYASHLVDDEQVYEVHSA